MLFRSSHSPLVAAGLGYARKIKETAQGDFIENATHLALSKILSEKISLGFAGKYIHQEVGNLQDSFFDGDLGAFFVLTPAVQLGGVIHNVAASDLALERAFGIGSRIKAWDFLYVNSDVVKKIDGPLSQNLSLHAGMEVVHNTGVVFQMGFSAADRSEKNGLSLGLGWGEHKLGAFYAFQNALDGTGSQIHALSLRIFF